MWNPSYDFRLFDIGWISPLQADAYDVATSFRSSDPTAFVDRSLNQLSGLLNPSAAYPYIQRQLPTRLANVPFVDYFQGAEDTRARLQKIRDEADRVLREAGGGEPAKFPASSQPPATSNPTMKKGCSLGDLFWGRCHFENGVLVGTQNSGGEREPVGGNSGAAGKSAQAALDWMKALPEGSGLFLIAVLALIFLFLFVSRR